MLGRMSADGKTKKCKLFLPKFVRVKNKQYFCTGFQKLSCIMYRDPTCYVADIEQMTGASYRTAQRIMSKIRKHYGLGKREKPTIDMAKSFLVGC